MRHKVEHPVVNDSEFVTWRQYAVRAWPTLILIDPHGKVFGKHEGEFELSRFDALLADAIAEFRATGALNEVPLPHQIRVHEAEAGPLSYPGKVAADPERNRLFIADSGHDRVLVTDRHGSVEAIIGCGKAGHVDGDFERARLRNPQGLAVDGDLLYIADAGTHTIRLCDLRSESLKTIAGTGEQALFRHEGGRATNHPANSPYDLAVHQGILYIAMAGFHQLWIMDLKSDEMKPFAGDGIEDIIDGPRLKARLAQPYSVDASSEMLYFADSETSSVRSVPLATVDPQSAQVKTLVGVGLFDFGDRDGAFECAILQHVQDVAMAGRVLYCADSYNHKIKALDLNARTATTVAGCGESGSNDGVALKARFAEPSGLAYMNGVVYVADTNNHSIRAIDLKSNRVATLRLSGLLD